MQVQGGLACFVETPSSRVDMGGNIVFHMSEDVGLGKKK